MKTLTTATPAAPALRLAAALSIIYFSLFMGAALRAQLTPVPDRFTDWTGAVDNDFFNPGNWSTGVVPDSPTVAVRLPGDNAITHKNIVAHHDGVGDKTIQFYSIQTGANKSYTLEFSGNDDGLLIINPIGRGLTFDGFIGSTPQVGRSLDITYPEATGDTSTRLAAYYKFGKNTLLTFDGSYAGLRVAENGLASGIFTMTDNARMDLSKAGDIPFVYEGIVNNAPGVVTYTPGRQTQIYIGGLLETGPNTSIYVGGRYVHLNGKLTTGQVSIMGGLFYHDQSDQTSANATCDVYGDITRMTGQVNFEGDGRARFRVNAGAQYLVEGVHNGGISTRNSGATIGGSGIINGAIVVAEGGMLTAGYRESTIGNSPDTPLTINAIATGTAPALELNGSLSLDLVTATVHDRLLVNLSGAMQIRSPATVDLVATPNARFANLVINMADTFPRLVPQPVSYEMMTVNIDTVASGTTPFFVGDFRDVDETGAVTRQNVTLPASLSLKTSWDWRDTYEYNHTYQQDLLKQRVLVVTIEQTPFAEVKDARTGEPLLRGNRLAVAQKVDEVYNQLVNPATAVNPDPQTRAAYIPLFESLNYQPSIIQYTELLDQLTPGAYQPWFPSAVVRANSLVQSLEDRLYQDAAFKRKKGTVQAFLDGYRQEASRGKDDLVAYSNYGIIGTVVGADYAIRENLVAGGFIGYEKTEFDLDTAGGSCDVDSLTFGLKARYLLNENLQFNAVAFYGTDDYQSSRSVAMTRLGVWADVDTSGTRLGAAASAAYTFRPAWFEITPVLGLQWLDWEADAFQERNGGGASLSVYKQSATSQQGKAGVRIARSFPLKHGLLRPYLHYSWLHEFKSGTRTLDYDLFSDVLPDPRHRVEVPATNANGWRLDFGVDWNPARDVRVSLRYQSEYRGAANESVGLRAAVNYTF
ncbi:MAG: autotransporter outer membrane beta-barrel domain-containing protein [Opitutaceae bacterium]|jgi:outer membrane autotransporter protein|nr:autotransporter outer membrane beta-barrel domain-containing protein [Opitutaceae bacterium]